MTTINEISNHIMGYFDGTLDAFGYTAQLVNKIFWEELKTPPRTSLFIKIKVIIETSLEIILYICSEKYFSNNFKYRHYERIKKFRGHPGTACFSSHLYL